MNPIHPNSAVSEDHAFVALMSIANSHNLNYASISDIINLISGLLPSPNVFLQTNLRSLINKYVNIEDIMTRHSCCAACMDLLPLGGASNTCGRHGCIGTEKKEAFFFEISIKKQLKEHFEGILCCTAWYFYVHMYKHVYYVLLTCLYYHGYCCILQFNA